MENEVDLDISIKSKDWKIGWTNYLMRTPVSEIKDFFETHFESSDTDFENLTLKKLLLLFYRLEIISEYFFLKPSDDRMEYFEFQDDCSDAWKKFRGTIIGLSYVKKLAWVKGNVNTGIKCVAAVVKKARYLEYLDEKERTLNDVIKTTFNNRNFCGRYADQPCIARGTAFLIREDLLLTARHNLYDENGRILDEDLVYIFDFQNNSLLDRPTIDSSNVYSGKAIGPSADPFEDWAVIHLNPEPKIGNSRPVECRTPLHLSRATQQPRQFRGFYSAGFSLGIPLKIVMVGHYVKQLNQELFTVNLDLFYGNSGSPIITLNTNELVGMLISGFPDFCEPETDCLRLRSYQYSDIGKGSAGERIIWIGNAFVGKINRLLTEEGIKNL